jgi:hypothetical protein
LEGEDKSAIEFQKYKKAAACQECRKDVSLNCEKEGDHKSKLLGDRSDIY